MNETKALTVTEVRKANAEKIVALVEDRRDQLQKLLVGQDVERFMTVALQAVMANPDLLDSDPISTLSAIREAATYGLEPVGPLGDGALIPYRDKGKTFTQFQPMYRGLMKLARRSGEVATIDGKVVYENDEYERQFGTDPFIRHVPTPLGKERGKYVGVYAYAKLRSGELVVVELTLADIDRARKSSRTDKVWTAHPGPMMLKTAIKALMKLLPLEPTAQEAVAYDDQVELRQVAHVSKPSEARQGLLGRLGVASSGDEVAEAPEAVPEPQAGDTDELTDAEIEELLEDPTDADPDKVVEADFEDADVEPEA